MIKNIMDIHEEKLKKTVDSLKKEYASLRAGRATPALLDKITVNYYGAPTPVNQIATIKVPEPRLLTIQPYESNMLQEIERAILKSDLGLNPNSDGKILRLSIPQLTRERRTELAKTTHKKAEEAKVAARNIRRDANDAIKKLEKDKSITEDELKKGQESVQKLLDKYIKEIDSVMAAKEKEIMEG